MKFVEVKRAIRRDLDQMCRDLDLNKQDVDTMEKWYFNSTEVWSGFYKETLACLYGVYSSSFLSDTAYLWLTTNGVVKEHPFLFVRHSQMMVRKLLESHNVIIGHVNARHKDSIRWLEWLGVKLRRQDVENDMIPFELKRSA